MITLPSRSKGRPRTIAPEIRKTVISSDWHIPSHDTAAYRTLLNFLQDVRPDYHIINGDFFDLADQSTYLTEPELAGRTEEAIDTANTVLDELENVSPNTITKVLFGNHEKRLTKRLYENPDLLPFVTRGKKPDQLLAESLSLDERGIDWFGYPDVYNHYGFAITHGEASGLHAAKKELEVHGVSGCSGHIHKQRSWERRDRSGVTYWYSIGGLTRRDVGYRPNNDWVQGIGVLEQVVGTETFTFHQLPIVKGQFVYAGKLYNQDGGFEAA